MVDGVVARLRSEPVVWPRHFSGPDVLSLEQVLGGEIKCE
jgi:hypothetical protein